MSEWEAENGDHRQCRRLWSDYEEKRRVWCGCVRLGFGDRLLRRRRANQIYPLPCSIRVVVVVVQGILRSFRFSSVESCVGICG